MGLSSFGNIESSEAKKVFGLIKECEDGRDVKKLLKGEICRTGFKRLT